MALKAKRFFTASIPELGVVLWDTTLRPLCKQLIEYDSTALSYSTIYLEMQKKNKFEFTNKDGVLFIIQRLERDSNSKITKP